MPAHPASAPLSDAQLRQNAGNSKLLGDMCHVCPDRERGASIPAADPDRRLRRAKRYILFHGKRHPKDTGSRQFFPVLKQLAVERKFSSSIRNQAVDFLRSLAKRALACEDFAGEDIKPPEHSESLPAGFDPSDIGTTTSLTGGVLVPPAGAAFRSRAVAKPSRNCRLRFMSPEARSARFSGTACARCKLNCVVAFRLNGSVCMCAHVVRCTCKLRVQFVGK